MFTQSYAECKIMAVYFSGFWILAFISTSALLASGQTSIPFYEGCYLTTSTFDISLNNVGPVSVAQCINTCLKGGFSYAVLRGFGVPSDENSTCFCRQELLQQKTDSNRCSKNCPSDSRLKCGDGQFDYLSIYRTECIPGSWGHSDKDLCINECHCAYNQTCNITTGHCPGGLCMPGWSSASPGQNPERCHLQCDPWPSCAQECHCSDGAPCNETTGSCSNGCEPGYTGDSCSEKCIPGTYGSGCDQECHCSEGAPCDHVTGSCSTGCEVGFIGNSCSQSLRAVLCELGIPGANCTGLNSSATFPQYNVIIIGALTVAEIWKIL